jgi:hypothetical protein
LNGGVAQLGEHLLCKQGVTGSIPVVSTILERQFLDGQLLDGQCLNGQFGAG